MIEQTTGKYLQRFSWLSDNLIGKISHEWNWLVGWYKEPKDGKPKVLHYTEGGPWFEQYQDCEYANEYYKVERSIYKPNIKRQEVSDRTSRPKTVERTNIARSI